MPSMPMHKDSSNPEWAIAQAHEFAEPFSLISVKLQNRKSVEAVLCLWTGMSARLHGNRLKL